MRFCSVLHFCRCGKSLFESNWRGIAIRTKQPRLLGERSMHAGIAASNAPRAAARPVRSVTVNMAESPLGWLFARGFVSQRQFDAGERLRSDWERAQLAPRITMTWD